MWDKLSDLSRRVFSLAVKASGAILGLTLILLVYAGDFSPVSYGLWRLAAELYRMPVAIMLISLIVVAALESRK